MFWLIILGIIVIVILTGRDKTPTPPSNDLNQQWVDYIAAYRQNVKSKSEKALLSRMLDDLVAQGMPTPSASLLATAEVVDREEYDRFRLETSEAHGSEAGVQAAAAAVAQPESIVQAAPDWQAESPQATAAEPVKLDNTTLLLYFGAFLFIASAGLFVALSGAYGELRVATILTVMAALYFGGLWLYDNKPKLQSASYTFIGMGLMLAPLAGLATYSYVMRDRPELVWLLTSVLCLGLYGHALRKLKTPLMEYIFIGTFVSLFESAISVLKLPLYYYGWGFAAVGLCMQAWALYRKKATDYDEPATMSSGLLIPLSIMTALYMLPDYGVVQLGVSLLLAALYYGLQAWKAQDDYVRVNNTVVAQVSLLFSLSCFAYGWQHKLSHVVLVLMALGFIQLLVLMTKAASALTKSVATVGFLSLVTAALLAWQYPGEQVAATVFAAAYGVLIWIHQQRSDMYVVATLVAATLPFSIGLRAVETPWHAWGLAAATFGIALGQLAAFALTKRTALDTDEWRTSWRSMLLLTLGLGCFVSVFAGSVAILVAGVAVALTAYGIGHYDASPAWRQSSSLFAALPAVFSVSRPSAWLAALLVGCAWNLLLVVANRLELARWLGSALWLLLPVGFARVFPSLDTASWYAASYFVCMVGMVVARAVAQKRIARLPIALSELERRLHSDSQAYVAGYALAGIVSFVASLSGPRMLPAIMGTLQAALWVYIARSVERRPDIIGLVPVLLQGALWGTYRDASSVNLYVFGSTMIALAGYLYGWLQSAGKSTLDYGRQLQTASLIMLYLAPATAMFFETHWTMPLGLAVAGLATLHAAWGRAQNEREMAGGVVVLALMWLLGYNGVDNTQVYTHILAALFGLYAYWRNRLGDKETSHSYLVAMLCAATIPLGFEVMGGTGGGLYGWWFLGEQVAIMLFGMAIGDRFVTRWGMYVAVGAVLYQLRSLAWLSLTLLALFLIGLAVYRLQKSDK